MVSVTGSSSVDSSLSDGLTTTSAACSGVSTAFPVTTITTTPSPSLSDIPIPSSSLYSTVPHISSSSSGDNSLAAAISSLPGASSLSGDHTHVAVSLLHSLLSPPYNFSPVDLAHLLHSSHLPASTPSSSGSEGFPMAAPLHLAEIPFLHPNPSRRHASLPHIS